MVVLPILTKKRTQCSLFCPLGPLQSLTNRINPFEISLDRGKCVQCMKCVAACPTFSIDERGVKEGRTKASCVKCRKMRGYLPEGGIVLSREVDTSFRGGAGRGERHRLLFLFPAFLVLATMAGGFFQDALIRLMRLITTGSLLA